MPETKKAGKLHGRKYLCGTPDNHCCGVLKSYGKKAHKLHSTTREAFRCLVHYYMSLGYTQGENHTMIPPEGSDLCIQLLPKQSKMTAARPGKEGRWRSEYNADLVNA